MIGRDTAVANKRAWPSYFSIHDGILKGIHSGGTWPAMDPGFNDKIDHTPSLNFAAR
jgi:hypothetical protein